MLSLVKILLNEFGPWALVTGASSGIGKEIALQLGELGFGVVISGRNEQALTDLATQLSRCEVIVADLSTTTGLESLCSMTESLEIGLIVANAGFGTSGDFLQSDIEGEVEMLRLNCEAPLRLARSFGPKLAARGRGGFIFLSSIVAWQGVAGQTHYSATKGYIQNLAEGLAIEWRSRGITVLSAAPGPVDTKFAQRAGLNLGMTDDAKLVARDILRNLGRKTTVIPGRFGKLLSYGLAIAPRAVRAKIMAGVAKGMLKR